MGTLSVANCPLLIVFIYLVDILQWLNPPLS